MALPILDGNQSATTLSTIFTAGAHIPAHTVVSLGSQAISDITSGISGSVVSISNFPASTVVSAYGVGTDGTWRAIEIAAGSNRLRAEATISGTVPISISSVTVGNSVTIASLPAISGTVTVGAMPEVILGASTVYDSGDDSLSVNIKNIGGGASLSPSSTFPVSGTVTVGNSVTIGSLPAISGTVTANGGDGTFLVGGLRFGSKTALSLDGGTGYLQTKVESMPNGVLTTRFGSVVTANQSFITSAVTNSNRKYLLAQNISAGTVTIGIGFSPTTTQGIQLSAGGGLTFDAFCPTGAVYWLGAVTGAAFTILEG